MIISFIKKVYLHFKYIIRPVVGYKGNFKSFDEAELKVRKNGGGYDSSKIFEKVKASTLSVVNGEACFERDSFLFYDKEVNYNLMMYLYKIYIENKSLKVLDFGGSLGSVYFQHKKELDDIGVQWTVCEQEHFVKFGKDNLSSKNLHFSYMEDLKNEDFNVLILSGVLQYIKDADSIINMLLSRKITNVIIERNPVGVSERYWIETVHEPIYEASYPCKVFCETDFIRKIENYGYELLDTWHSLVDFDIKAGRQNVQLKSFIFKLKS